MTRLFLSLFVVLTLGLLFIRQSGEWLYHNIENNEGKFESRVEQVINLQLANLLLPPADDISQESWLKTLSAQLNQQTRRLPKEQIALAQGQTQALTSGHVVTYESAGNQIYILANFDDNHYLQIGPVDFAFDKNTESNAAQWLHLLSYLLLACLVLLWSHPLWRDLKKLIRDAEQIGSGDYDIKNGITKTSVVYPLSKTLGAMSKKIQDLITLQKQMTHAVSHDIRTPLARLKFSLAILTGGEQGRNDLPTVSQEMLKDVEEIENLIDEMLTYGRLESDAIELKLEQVNIHQLTENLCQKLSRNHHNEIALKCPVNLMLNCDGHFIERALQNILVNAQRYAKGQVLLSISQHGPRTRFMIEDDGPGIAEADWQCVFQPFVRIEASRNKRHGGFGLGLAIAAKIVEWHNGDINADKSDLGGARFTLTFPGAP